MPVTDEHIRQRRAAAATLRAVATICHDAADRTLRTGPYLELCRQLAAAGADLQTLAAELAILIHDQNGQGEHNRIQRKDTPS